ncbi:LOW QUALITY PROTEIN: hypothetical protein SETIT_4G099500v2 [Setaria italica]|uniref:F-box/LRR-repeat protein 15/At3g58940/PEG3-like LRR domain-containing protein n=1 Tax=Setaria italica TaxID=4555 RepID=A0A368QSR8_SETIT|nr:LOW QUALITY PROTEIN: hypothetical protein SETIT_4G099500v2 [Setaria italica]
MSVGVEQLLVSTLGHGHRPPDLHHGGTSNGRRYDEEEVASLITRILATHPGPGRRFSAHVVHLLRRPATVDAWLQSPALDGLEELEFDIGGLYEAAPELPLPASAFRFSATLRVATIAKCRFPDDALCLPSSGRRISEGALHGVIAGCPVLESLLLTGRSRFSCIRINSQSLVSLGLRVYTEELIIEDAPLLERLLQLEFRIATHLDLGTQMISAPKLETLGCLCDLDFYSKMTSEAAVIQELSAASSVTVVSSAKNLAINIPSLSIDMFVDLMKCFPCLEKLYIQIVGLKNYQGIKSQVNFARFLY